MDIFGERLYLKQLTENDITDDMMLWFENTELMRYYTNSGRKITKQELTHSIREGVETQTNYTFGIFVKDQHRIIGTVKLGPINKKHGISDLATLLGDADYHGKGYSSEAIELGTHIAFEKYGIRRLYGGMYASNIPSIKTYLRAGWIVEGRLKGYYLTEGKSEDRILVGCFNPACFSLEEINEIKNNSKQYGSF
ncbi:MAG: GNAT family N-acetyltransferase [Bacteroides sp.]|nr:GNAT family N-acetyltransferase [Ruminococcus flavefaciens]MCM1554530.1 GNAT family N-acetyltransferase [Bacteroides sp.]